MTLPLEELERLYGEGTPGEWFANRLRTGSTVGTTRKATYATCLMDVLQWTNGAGDKPDADAAEANARFIALSHNVMPQMIAEIRRLRQALEAIANADSAMEGGSIALCRRKARQALTTPEDTE